MTQFSFKEELAPSCEIQQSGAGEVSARVLGIVGRADLHWIAGQRDHTAVLSLTAGTGGAELELSWLGGHGITVGLGGLNYDLKLGRAGGSLALELDSNGAV